ncbi:hypothetical protein T10_8753 [Trichinella papuae]|uniref:Uncharacterized protein n=1 Tax=Trichinella papuae TaxID=268474 RepID=A0A0V1MAK7_9BILA|nr:hypothetical protein T10_8753 [Trichinella papuae]
MAQENQSTNQQFDDPESVWLTTSTCFPYDLLNCQLKQCHRCRFRMLFNNDITYLRFEQFCQGHLSASFLFIKEETFKIETVNNIDQQLLTDWLII